MTLKELLDGVKIKAIYGAGDLNVWITNITFDSRKATADDLFIAIKGEKNDGHDYVANLISNGIKAVVVEDMTQVPMVGVHTAIIEVSDSHEALGLIAANYFGNPSKKLSLVGVTGTNGKTTVATLIYEMARKGGFKAGLLSTVANYIDNIRLEATHTTPDPISLNRILREMVDCGCKIAAMEVSSHAAHQKRIAGLHFTGGVFTNLTRDHLDYHGDFAAYRDAKKIFFDSLPSTAFSLINVDDRNGRFMVQNTKSKVYTYALHHIADFHTSIVEKHINGTLLSINHQELHTQFSGIYNAYNLTAVYGTLELLGFAKDSILVDLSAMTPVAGRFQTFLSSDGKTAVIDYAHTPDALENVLQAINEVKTEKQHIISVIGAGGNRDKGKRPMMAKIAVDMSWKTILTSDNPRYENPNDIISDMEKGISVYKKNDYLVNVDRREAIRTAFLLAQKGDIILIAGKGHEDYQEIQGVKHHFSDAEEVEKIMYS